MTHGWCGLHQDIQIVFYFPPCQSPSSSAAGLVLLQVQDFAFPLAELQDVPLSSLSCLVKIPLVYQPLPSVLSNSRLAEGTLCPTFLTILNRTEHSITPLDALLPTSLHHDFLAQTSTPCLPLWAALNPSHWLVIQPMGDSFIEVQAKNTTCSPLFYQASLFHGRT